MVILQSNSNLSSQRTYSKKVQRTDTSVTWANNSNTFTARQSSFSALLTSSEAYSDGDFSYPSYNKMGEDLSMMKNEAPKSSSPIDLINKKAAKQTTASIFSQLIDLIRRVRYQALGLPTDNATSFTSSSNPTIWNRLQSQSYFMEENETTMFSASGNVVTKDGRNLSFDVTFEMSRSFTKSYGFDYFTQYPQIFTDPLVINLDSNPTEIADKHFLFDLDCDGKEEEIPFLSSNCAFLAYDKNNDGIINDGSELFGAKTGNGFWELSQYDLDNNGYIDEADEIFDKLKVWSKDENGKDILLSLKEADIGAIYTGYQNSLFSINDSNNHTLAKVKATGYFLKESGGTGILQQVDFAG